jgi:hypothetical protein
VHLQTCLLVARQIARRSAGGLRRLPIAAPLEPAQLKIALLRNCNHVPQMSGLAFGPCLYHMRQQEMACLWAQRENGDAIPITL